MAVRRFSTSSIRTGTKSSKFWDQLTDLNSYESIQTYTVTSGGAASITFSNIPATYKHLQLRYIARTTGSVTNSGTYMKFNGSSVGYQRNGGYAMYGTGGGGTPVGTNSWQGTSTAGGAIGQTPGGNIGASVFAGGVIDILDYADTNKYTTAYTQSGYDNNGSGWVIGLSFHWENTAAVNEILILPDNSLVQYSRFALYGIKGA